MDLRHLRCVAYDTTAGTVPSLSERNLYLRLVWKPDVSSLTNDQARNLFQQTTDIQKLAPIFDKFDRLSVFIFVQITKAFSKLFEQEQPQHLQMFHDWVSR